MGNLVGVEFSQLSQFDGFLKDGDLLLDHIAESGHLGVDSGLTVVLDPLRVLLKSFALGGGGLEEQTLLSMICFWFHSIWEKSCLILLISFRQNS